MLEVGSAPGYDNAMQRLQTIVGGQQDLAHQAIVQAQQKAAQQMALQQAAQARAAAIPMGGVSDPARMANMQDVPYRGSYGTGLDGWIHQALGIMHLGPEYAQGIRNLIMHESGGNPNSVNRWDSNWLAGHPSKGLMQTIPGTFSEYAMPGYNHNIFDPISNIIAGTRYALKNYGARMLLGGGRHDSHGNYIGY